jgi:uncharacterized glyoxalase superfamily protein PhnB
MPSLRKSTPYPLVGRGNFGLIKQPDEIGGYETQSPYVIVTDADAVYAQARAAGATIALDIKDEDYRGARLQLP